VNPFRILSIDLNFDFVSTQHSNTTLQPPPLLPTTASNRDEVRLRLEHSLSPSRKDSVSKSSFVPSSQITRATADNPIKDPRSLKSESLHLPILNLDFVINSIPPTPPLPAITWPLLLHHNRIKSQSGIVCSISTLPHTKIQVSQSAHQSLLPQTLSQLLTSPPSPRFQR